MEHKMTAHRVSLFGNMRTQHEPAIKTRGVGSLRALVRWPAGDTGSLHVAPRVLSVGPRVASCAAAPYAELRKRM